MVQKYVQILHPGFPGGSVGKESACNAIRSLGQEDPLEKGMATHSSILACKILQAEEPGRPQSMGLQTDMTEQLALSLVFYK